MLAASWQEPCSMLAASWQEQIASSLHFYNILAYLDPESLHFYSILAHLEASSMLAPP